MDDDERAVLIYVLKTPGCTTTDIAKALFDSQDDRTLRNNDRRVRYYLEKNPCLLKVDVVGGKKRFSIPKGRMWVGISRIEMLSSEGDEISIGMGDTLIYFDEENRPNVVVIGKKDSEEYI